MQVITELALQPAFCVGLSARFEFGDHIFWLSTISGELEHSKAWFTNAHRH